MRSYESVYGCTNTLTFYFSHTLLFYLDSEKIKSSVQTVLDSTSFIFEKALKTPDSLRKPKDTSQKSGNNKKRTPVSIKEIFSMQMARQNATPAKSADIMKTPVKTNVSIICKYFHLFKIGIRKFSIACQSREIR